MTAAAFDPLAAVQALEAAGIDRKHAEAHAAQLRPVANADLGRFATRADLDSPQRWLDSLPNERPPSAPPCTMLALAGDTP